MVDGLTKYRNELVERDPSGFQLLQLNKDLWNPSVRNGLDGFLLNIISGGKISGYSPEKMVDKYGERMEGYHVFSLLNVRTIKLVLDNDEWANLMIDDMVNNEPPFYLDTLAEIQQELDFYHIEKGMKVAEIGAGRSVFCLLLGLTYDSLSIYVNDLRDEAVAYNLDEIQQCKSIRPGNKFIGVEGRKKSTKLENMQLDKIIIRNSYHHFSHRPEMLKSLRKSLTAGGDLFIADPTLQPGKQPHCNKTMYADAIRQELMTNGFDVVEERAIDGGSWVVFHCRVAEQD